jgi:AAA15 family ATPase/GTPase
MGVMMSDNFIKNIQINRYKCFENFKADGFKRVNLISGKNNIGKTALMEAIHISMASDDSLLWVALGEIRTHRDFANLLLGKEDLKNIILKNIGIECGSVSIKQVDSNIVITLNGVSKHYTPEALRGYIDIFKINFQIQTYMLSSGFISQNVCIDDFVGEIISQVKLKNKYERLNEYLNELFGIQNVDVILGKPMIKKDDKYINISEFGQGIKSFIAAISSLLIEQDNAVFIDEIENGLHYSLIDRFWEIILKISKEQNVQLFATTHSKECIEAYCRAATKASDDEIAFINLTRNKKDEIAAIVLNRKMLKGELEQNHEVRGW